MRLSMCYLVHVFYCQFVALTPHVRYVFSTSWGTKGDNSTHTDLGDAKKDGQVVEVEVPVSSADM